MRADETIHNRLGDLPPRHDAVACIAGLTPITLQHDELVLRWLIAVEPARTHDCVWVTAGALRGRLAWITDQGAKREAEAERLLDDEAADAAGCANDQDN
jgi:hypothetical protein